MKSFLVQSSGNSELAVSICSVASEFRGLISVVVTLVGITNRLDAGKLEAARSDGGNIAIVRVDACNGTAGASDDVTDRDGPLVLSATISARAVEFAEVLHTEVGDDNVSTAVVLDNLVIGVLCTTAIDRASSGFLLDCDCVFADVLEPNVGQSAGTQAVNTFSLVGTNHDVRELSTIFQEEDCSRVALFGLTFACAGSAIEPDVTTIEGLTSGNGPSG